MDETGHPGQAYEAASQAEVRRPLTGQQPSVAYTLLVQWTNLSPIEVFTFDTFDQFVDKFREIKIVASNDGLSRTTIKVWAAYGRQLKLTPEAVYAPTQSGEWAWVEVDDASGATTKYCGAIFS